MLFELLRQTYATLSKSHRRLADYLASNYRRVAMMTSSQLAREVNVNEATVTRFAQQLGYAGYPALIQELRGLITAELSDQTPDGNRHPVSSILQSISEATQRLDQQLNAEALVQARQMLVSANQVVILAQGNAAPLAQLFAEFLRMRSIPVTPAPGDPYAIAAAVAESGESMLVTGISLSDESASVAAALRFARQRGAATLAVASSPTNPVVQSAQVAITWLGDETRSAMNVVMGISLLAALAQSLPLPLQEQTDAREQALAQASEAILGRRRR